MLHSDHFRNLCILVLLLYRCLLHMDNVYGSDIPLVGLLEMGYLRLIRYGSSLRLDLDMESQRIKLLYMGEVG